MKKEKDIRELAVRYFEGRISRDDENLLFHYLKQGEENRANFRLWEKEWAAANVSDWETQQEWESLQRRLRTQEAILPMLSFSSFSWKRIAAVAAIVLLTVGSTLGLWQTFNTLRSEKYFVCETPYGEKSKVLLSDGTVVWLNAGSTLKYSNKFNTSNRRVQLEGEGYFEVTKQNGAAFVVQTKGYDVIVKGTKFNVSAYTGDSFVSTSLLEGLVELDYKGCQIKMFPGEQLRLDLASGRFVRRKMNVALSKAWSENRIEFEDITLKELVVKLSRQYDVNIRLESEKLSEKRFRISLRNRETIGEVMDALKKIIPITVERKEKDIYIKE